MLHEMRNFGMMSGQQLNGLIRSIPKKGSTVRRGEISYSVHVGDVQVLSAARIFGNKWHVRAVEGLIETRVKAVA